MTNIKVGKNGEISISDICSIFEKNDEPLLKQVRRDRPYKIPHKYMEWRLLSTIVASALIQVEERRLIDKATWLHSHRTALWYVKNSPIYCVSERLLEAFNHTDIEDKKEVLKSIQPSIYSFILLFPKGSIYSAENSAVDFAVCCVSDRDKPEETYGSYKNISIDYLQHEHKLNIHFSTIDNAGNVWFSGMGLYSDGSIYYDDKNQIGRNSMDTKDRNFLARMRSIILQTFFVLQHEPELLGDFSEQDFTRSGKGFSTIKNEGEEKFWRPRSLDFKKPNKSKPEARGIGKAKRPHPRRGFIRVIGYEENKRLVWVRPTFVHANF